MTGRMNWDRERTRKQQQAHDPLQSGRAYLREHKPLTDRQRSLIVKLRAELGDAPGALPATCHEGRAVISALLDRKKTL